ncbi:DUF2637 domain-containing protein [Rathayibacter rathayi]|uniref:DUF2637 domain-containing protein n=1 Tax=Rathayibacter rathayi TaxID=33887 RepID=A0ABX5AFV6_RATRA|nr:DUF2637 domain-containing protein [Rathayibacter rathayi]PPF23108.1 hypothetical protein C5C34_09775 [Rathayibacter rathayi]PPF51626.1 hypothetical protein C5C08_02135 [Rathayibacter rathayi]PPF83216.1 hypothetical protein C5C14_02170 [Rathayibacter rathayi]PPG14396.1 hypothetical protein C5C11_04995 [Rathayibacter rathayi]PPG47047.1 hypothetical protein C5C20_02130 [Rathayibacter rathayi]
MSESRRTATISPDRWYVGASAIVLVGLIMAASYVFSFTAITEAAAWTGNPAPTHWLAAVFIDGAIVTYTITYAVFRSRGERARQSLFFLYLFTAVSVAVNAAHSASFWDWDFAEPQAQFGVLIAVAAPVAALLASEEVVRLAFQLPLSKAGPAVIPASESASETDALPSGQDSSAVSALEPTVEPVVVPATATGAGIAGDDGWPPSLIDQLAPDAVTVPEQMVSAEGLDAPVTQASSLRPTQEDADVFYGLHSYS